jgi:hypothetical protein
VLFQIAPRFPGVPGEHISVYTLNPALRQPLFTLMLLRSTGFLACVSALDVFLRRVMEPALLPLLALNGVGEGNAVCEGSAAEGPLCRLRRVMEPALSTAAEPRRLGRLKLYLDFRFSFAYKYGKETMKECAIIRRRGKPPCPIPRSRTRIHSSFATRAKASRVPGIPAVEKYQATRPHVPRVSGRDAYKI